MYKIFINIASYRDPDLVNTIEDAYDKAKNPDNIFIGVSEQDDSQTINLILIKILNTLLDILVKAKELVGIETK